MTESFDFGRKPSVDRGPLTWDFFENLPGEKAAFYRIAQSKRLRKGERFVFEGETAQTICYIVEGKVIVQRVSSTGKEIILQIHSPGWMMGVGAAVTSMPFPTSAIALTPCVVYKAYIDDFKSLLVKYPVLTDRIMTELYIIVNFMTSQYLSFLTDRAETRVKKLLARLFSQELLRVNDNNRKNSIPLNVTQEQIATTLGISRPTVNIALRHLVSERLIDISAHKISFIKPDHFLDYLVTMPGPVIQSGKDDRSCNSIESKPQEYNKPSRAARKPLTDL
jgi:CRP/FNR family transcriptional regulator, cyclic AMP receptor protein